MVLLPWLQLLDAAIGRTEPTEDTKDLHAIKEELVSSSLLLLQMTPA